MGHARTMNPPRGTTRAAARGAREGSMVVPTVNDAGVATSMWVGGFMDGRIIVWVRRMAMCAVVRVSSASARVHFASPVSTCSHVASGKNERK